MFGPVTGGLSGGRGGSIPFSIADRTIFTAALRYLSGDTRTAWQPFELSRVLSVLDAGPVQRRFGMDEADAETIRRWIIEAGG